MNRDGEFFIYNYCLDKKIHKNRWMVINYWPPSGMNCQTYPMLLDIGRRVQALCTTVSFDKPSISCVRACVDVHEHVRVRGHMCDHPSFLSRRDWCALGILSSFLSSFPPRRGRLRKSSSLPCVLTPKAQEAWCASPMVLMSRNEVMDTWSNKEREDETTWERKLQKTTVARFPGCVSLFPGGAQQTGFGGLYQNPRSTSEGWSLWWGCSVLCWIHSERFLHDIQVVLFLLQRGFARWDGLTSKPEACGFLHSCQMQALLADYGSVPKWLSSFSGRVLWAWRRVGRADMERLGRSGFCKPGKVFGSPWSMGHHWSWYSKCLLHCTSLWKKIICWKVSKQILY